MAVIGLLALTVVSFCSYKIGFNHGFHNGVDAYIVDLDAYCKGDTSGWDAETEREKDIIRKLY